MTLPKYAFPYSHPAAQRGDVGAEFRGDDGGSICVSLEKLDGGMTALCLQRSGLVDNTFTPGELLKVAEIINVLCGREKVRGDEVRGGGFVALEMAIAADEDIDTATEIKAKL